jgi:hypothetical protein
MDEIRFEEFSELHHKIREDFLFEVSANLKDDAKRHLQRGFLARFEMMISAVRSFYNEIGKSKRPLDINQATNLSLLLNAYYLNLTASIDNFAWGLTYQFELISLIDEKDFNQQRIVKLFDSKFLQKLKKKKLNTLAEELHKSANWYQSVKRFRNPAAHSIPLYVPYTIFTEDDVKKWKEMDKKAAKLIKNGKLEEGTNLLIESYNLGSHYPVFLTESSQLKIHILAKQINDDHENFLKVVLAIFTFGFIDNKSNPV